MKATPACDATNKQSGVATAGPSYFPSTKREVCRSKTESNGGRKDVGWGETVADEQQRAALLLCERVGEAFVYGEASGVEAFASKSVRIGHGMGALLGHGDDLRIEAGQHILCRRQRILRHRYDQYFGERRRREQDRLLPFQDGCAPVAFGFVKQDGKQSRTI
jgi:hypothetical protein